MADYPNKIYKPRKMKNEKSHDSVDPMEEVKSAGVRGRVGRRFGCGEAICGEAECGEENPISNIYEQRKKREKYLGPGDKETGPPHTIKKTNYFPKNPQTIPQQAWRQVFKDMVATWNALNPAEKAEWNKKAAKLPYSGYCLFTKWYLDSH